MERVFIHFGSDVEFDKYTGRIDNYHTIGDVLTFINKQLIGIEGVTLKADNPLNIENLIINTDDYGGIKEWAIMGVSNNVFESPRVRIKNLYLNNPPKKLYKDVKKTYTNIIEELPSIKHNFDLNILKDIASDYNDNVIGQSKVLNELVTSLYSLVNPNRKKPITLLFLGNSGVGKTETAKFINSRVSGRMLRIQFSMQQTTESYKYIFGADHGEDSFARDLIRRESSVILLDEFDKVNPAFYNAFYQMFDEGVFVDENYEVNVERCIIICTSNFRSNEDAESFLGPPIFSRFTKVIKFCDIERKDKIRILNKNYEELRSQLSPEDLCLIDGGKVLNKYIKAINDGYYSNMRTLRNDVEYALNYEILKARGIL